MANAKQVLDVQVSKGITAAQGNEHLRNRSEEAEKYAMSKGNYDPTRKHLNFEIVPGGKVRPIDTSRNIPERIADILGRRGIKDPNEGLVEPKYRTVVNIIFGGSRKRMHELAFGTQKVDFEKGADNTRIKRKSDIERWAKDVYAFVCGRYGEQNIAAFIVHLDELNPHVHCTLLPIKDGRFAYKEIFAGKDKFEYSARMKQLHTDFFAEVNTKWGMERGRSVAETGARHRTTEEYRRMLSEECTTIEQQIGRHQEVLSALHSDIRLAERRVKGLTSMVENLKREKSEKEAQLSALENDMDTRKGDALTLSAEKEKLEKELTAIQGKLADKQEELRPVETTRYSTARPVFMPLVSDFPPPVPYLSLVTCHVKGKQRYFLSAPRFHSARSKFRRGADKENPVRVCPGRPLLDPPKPHSFLFHFLLHLYPARPYPPFYHHIYRPVPVSSPPSPSGFPAAKVGCRA